MTPEQIAYAKEKARNIAAALHAWIEGRTIANVQDDDDGEGLLFWHHPDAGVPVLYFEIHEDYGGETWHEVVAPKPLTLYSIQDPSTGGWQSTTNKDLAGLWRSSGHVVVTSTENL